MLIAGIDEAGRGPCLGPLVMAITTVEKKDEEKFIEIGVKDSKELSPKDREEKFLQIKKIAEETNFMPISAKEIDTLRERYSLNEIEAMHAAKLLNSLEKKPKIVYVDSPDTIMAEFGRRIEKYLTFKTKIISEHKADANYPVVSAASIIAKVERDDEIKKIAEKFGPVGSGYPGDENTIKFLRKYFQENNIMPDIARMSWQTVKNLQDEKFQKKLF